MRRDLKRAYGRLFAEVRVILNRHDLMGLIALGCPEGEYEPEVEQILPRLRDADNAEDAAVIVQDVFTRMFSQPQGESAVAAAAEDIWSAYKRSRVD